MNFFKKLLTNTGPKPYFTKRNTLKSFLIGENFEFLKNTGNKNKDKIFYVIRRSPGAGLFSNVTFVINHLKICDKYKFIPIIDMENFTTIYNEKNKVEKTFNAWEYYFEKLNKYTLKEVYQSQNVILTSPSFQTSMTLNISKNNFNKYLKKIIIKKKFKKIAMNFCKKNFLAKDRVLGVHFRGSTYKTARGHGFPATLEEMVKQTQKLIKKYGYNKIFLITEEEKYYQSLKKIFGEKIITYPSYRMLTKDSFKVYPRKNHRYKLGKETLIETLILSKCEGITYIKSNVTTFSKNYCKFKQNDHEMFFGHNSRNKYISRWFWYLKNYFPFIFGKIKNQNFSN